MGDTYMDNALRYSTAEKLIRLKIERNTLITELLTVESTVLKKEIVLKYRTIEANSEKIKHLASINAIEHKQIPEYTLERESEVAALVEIINEYYIPVQELKEAISELRYKSIKLLSAINDLTAQIPNETMITNFKLKFSKLNPDRM